MIYFGFLCIAFLIGFYVGHPGGAAKILALFHKKS